MLSTGGVLSVSVMTKEYKKTFSIKMEVDVGMSKQKKYANKVGSLT